MGGVVVGVAVAVGAVVVCVVDTVWDLPQDTDIIATNSTVPIIQDIFFIELALLFDFGTRMLFRNLR
jgi:hypothetical protein